MPDPFLTPRPSDPLDSPVHIKKKPKLNPDVSFALRTLADVEQRLSECAPLPELDAHVEKLAETWPQNDDFANLIEVERERVKSLLQFALDGADCDRVKEKYEALLRKLEVYQAAERIRTLLKIDGSPT